MFKHILFILFVALSASAQQAPPAKPHHFPPLPPQALSQIPGGPQLLPGAQVWQFPDTSIVVRHMGKDLWYVPLDAQGPSYPTSQNLPYCFFPNDTSPLDISLSNSQFVAFVNQQPVPRLAKNEKTFLYLQRLIKGNICRALESGYGPCELRTVKTHYISTSSSHTYDIWAYRVYFLGTFVGVKVQGSTTTCKPNDASCGDRSNVIADIYQPLAETGLCKGLNETTIEKTEYQ